VNIVLPMKFEVWFGMLETNNKFRNQKKCIIT
jgi:hypothetical protein